MFEYVIILQQPTSSSHWLRGRLRSRSQSRITSSRVKISSGYPKQVYIPLKVAIQEPEIQELEAEIQGAKIQETKIQEAKIQEAKIQGTKMQLQAESATDIHKQLIEGNTC